MRIAVEAENRAVLFTTIRRHGKKFLAERKEVAATPAR
jgi:hypothetical protein